MHHLAVTAALSDWPGWHSFYFQHGKTDLAGLPQAEAEGKPSPSLAGPSPFYRNTVLLGAPGTSEPQSPNGLVLSNHKKTTNDTMSAKEPMTTMTTQVPLSL